MSSSPRTNRCCSLRTILKVLIGLWVVVFVTGLLAPAILKVRIAAARSQSTNNLKQMGIAINFGIVGRYDGLLPPSVGRFPAEKGPNSTILFHLIVDIEAGPFYDSNRTHPDEISPEKETVKIYCAPLDPTNPCQHTLLTSYASNAAVFGLHDGGTTRYKSFEKRGTANYVMFMERYAVVGPDHIPHNFNSRGKLDTYLYPGDDDTPDPEEMTAPQFNVASEDARNDAPHSFKVAGAEKVFQVALADGSARRITPDVLRTFTYGDGRTATIWAWACSLDGPLGDVGVPSGW